MKLATLPGDGPDGRLAIVSRDLTRAIFADDIAPTLQAALDRWDDFEPDLRARAAELSEGRAPAFAFDPPRALAPLPRAWQWLDGSAFPSHGVLMQQAFGMPPIESPRPLMYQGLSHRFLSGSQDVPLPSEEDGIDFEGEFGVLTDAVPMGTRPESAVAHVKLIVLINDWSLRALGVEEMKTGFGWVLGKPACSVAPVAVTPDELGDRWADGRVRLPLNVWRNGEAFGAADGSPMAVGFHELIAHAARTRELCAGTIIGSGTVSNEDARAVGSSCITERRALDMIEFGDVRTPFLRFGERVRMEVRNPTGGSLFGSLDQQVVRATAPA